MTILFYNKVAEFINNHCVEWDIYKKTHNLIREKGLSLRSTIGVSLLMDICYLAKDIEEGYPFINEYWIGSLSMDFLRGENDYYIFKDGDNKILGKFLVVFDGYRVTDISWFQDEDCVLQNKAVNPSKNDEIKKLSWSWRAKQNIK